MKLPLATWLALMVQVPALITVTVPAAVALQTDDVVEAYEMAPAEFDVTAKVNCAGVAVALTVKLPTGAPAVKVGAPGAALMVKVFETDVAGAKEASPAWLAVTVHDPAVTRASVVPLTVQTADVVDANETGRLDDDVATKVAGTVPMVWLVGAAKVMVCVDRDDTAPNAKYVAMSSAWAVLMVAAK